MIAEILLSALLGLLVTLLIKRYNKVIQQISLFKHEINSCIFENIYLYRIELRLLKVILNLKYSKEELIIML